MLRACIARQRNVLSGAARRAQSTNSNQPITPRPPPPPETRSEIPTPPTLPPDPKGGAPLKVPSPNNPTTPVVPRASASASSASSSSAGAKSPPPPPPPPSTTPPLKPKRRRFRRFLFYSTSLLGLSFAGGVYYSLISDNFHDFFTEYVPFGEDAVLYLEEREFKRRFPNRPAPQRSQLYPQTTGENKVNVAGKSGVSARVTEEVKDEPPKKDILGKSDRAVTVKKEAKPEARATATPPPPKKEKPQEKPVKKEATKALAPKDDPLGKSDRAVATTKDGKPAETSPKSQKPISRPTSPPTSQQREVSQLAATATPAAPIDALAIDNAADPVVQNVTKILNDVIAVVNADNAAGKYSSTISKAKDEVNALARDISSFRSQESKAADDKIRQSQVEFDEGARQLIQRIENEQRDQALSFREEYESERERLSKTYDNKLRAELQSAQKIADQKLQNELLDQNVKLTDDFTASVQDRVEKERSARLSRLNELAAQVESLETLTTQWGSILDSNLRTQHLVVAVQAVRAALDRTDRPTPFVRELVALKETANDSSLVNAAISSIHPSAYQSGVPTAAQLIDRFRRVATEVRKASLLPEDAGAASHAASRVLSKVMFKKQGLPVGEDVESVLTRTEMFLEEGNLDEATREMNALEGWAKVLSSDWLRDCRMVLEVRQALDVIATEARLQSLLVQ